MSDRPLVSILTPTYAHAGVIRACIASVKAQTYDHWEMIILDDGSTDSTYADALAEAGDDSRIRVYTQANKGIFHLSENYAFMLARSTGSFIALLDGDDVWEPEKLQWQVEALKQHPNAVLCWSKAKVAAEDAVTTLQISPADDDPKQPVFTNDPAGSILTALYFDNCIPALTIVMRREALERIGGFQQTHGQPLVDLPTLLALAMEGPFVYLPRVTGAWRTYVHQVTKTFPARIIEGRRDCVYAHYALHQSKLPNMDMQAVQRHYDRSLIIGYSRNGRYALVKKQRKEARRWYVKSMFYPAMGLWMWRVRSFVGWVLSWCGLDVEGLAGIMGKRTYR